MKSYVAPAFSAMAALVLTACGGGGGGGGGSGVAPVASTPAPTASATNTSLTNLVASQTFATVGNGVAANYTNAGVTTPTSFFPSGAGAVGLSYNAADQSYTALVYGLTNTFTPANRDAANSNAATTTYSITSGLVKYNLVLAAPAAVGLTYSSYGVWQQDVTGAPNTIRQSVFTYGLPTASTDLPRTGSASYAMRVGGFWLRGGDVRTLAGSSTFSADFAAGTTQLSMTLTGTSALNGAVTSFGAASGAGTIIASDSAISGALAGSGYSGSYAGRFYGPQAAEVGLTFDMRSGTDTVQGYVVGKK